RTITRFEKPSGDSARSSRKPGSASASVRTETTTELADFDFTSAIATPLPEIRYRSTVLRFRPLIVHSVVVPIVRPGGKTPVSAGTDCAGLGSFLGTIRCAWAGGPCTHKAAMASTQVHGLVARAMIRSSGRDAAAPERRSPGRTNP